MIINELKKLKLSQEVVTIERYGRESLTGYVSDVNDDVLCMHTYNYDGGYEGCSIFLTGAVRCIMWGDSGNNLIDKLISEKQPKITLEPGSGDLPKIATDLSKQHKFICFHLGESEDEEITGEILGFDEVWLKLHALGRFDTLSRIYAVIEREDITRVVINSKHYEKIAGLYKV